MIENPKEIKRDIYESIWKKKLSEKGETPRTVRDLKSINLSLIHI